MANPLSIPTSGDSARSQEQVARTIGSPFGDLFNFLTEDRPAVRDIKETVGEKVTSFLEPHMKREAEVRRDLPAGQRHLAMGAENVNSLVRVLIGEAPTTPGDILEYAGGIGLALGLFDKARAAGKLSKLNDIEMDTNFFKNGELEEAQELIKLHYGKDYDPDDAIEAISNVGLAGEKPLPQAIDALMTEYNDVRVNKGYAVRQEAGVQKHGIMDEVATDINAETPESDIIQAQAADQLISDITNDFTSEALEAKNKELAQGHTILKEQRANKADPAHLEAWENHLAELTVERNMIANKVEGQRPKTKPVSEREVTPQHVQQSGSHTELATPETIAPTMNTSDLGVTPTQLQSGNMKQYKRMKAAEKARIRLEDLTRNVPLMQNPTTRATVVEEPLARSLEGLGIGVKRPAARAAVKSMYGSQPAKFNENTVKAVDRRARKAVHPHKRDALRSYDDYRFNLTHTLQKGQADVVLTGMVHMQRITRKQAEHVFDWMHSGKHPSDLTHLTRPDSTTSMSDEDFRKVLDDFEMLSRKYVELPDKNARKRWMREQIKVGRMARKGR